MVADQVEIAEAVLQPAQDHMDLVVEVVAAKVVVAGELVRYQEMARNPAVANTLLVAAGEVEDMAEVEQYLSK